MEISKGISVSIGIKLIRSKFAPIADKKYLYPLSNSNEIFYYIVAKKITND